ncbi:MAG: hypothetical protein QOI74_2227 [Micromonosporaceae bacterium]|jgi:hypothetical protein|nr:hypothetical protein [Micromonosporaceae bacterium]
MTWRGPIGHRMLSMLDSIDGGPKYPIMTIDYRSAARGL